MSGTLTIHSSGDGSLLSGHSWIQYQPDTGGDTTYGTWGNNPMGQGNGLHTNLEQGRTGDASRSVHITNEQEKKLLAKTDEYQKKGEDGWTYLHPCSAFAADAWAAATGEHLADRSFGVISNPSKLKESIIAADKADTRFRPDPPPVPGHSVRQIAEAVEPCARSS
jgi:hypothetical protein